MEYSLYSFLQKRATNFFGCFALLLFSTSQLFGQQILWPQDKTGYNDQNSSYPINTVFQRDNDHKASIKFVVASNTGNVNTLQVHFKKYNLNGAIVTAAIDPRPGSNDANLSDVQYIGLGTCNQVTFQINVGEGMYQMEAVVNGATPVTRDFGVGEVLAIAGQSNAAGYAYSNNPEAPTDYPKFVQYNNTKTQFDSNDPGSAGVGRKFYKYYWGKLGSQLAAALNVPIAFYQAAWSGTEVHVWKLSSTNTSTAYPQGYPYQNLKDILQTVKSQVGLRGVLWHQGETYTTGNYNDELNDLIGQSRADAGGEVAWVVARVSYINGQAHPNIIASQNRLLTPNINNYGPNFNIVPKSFGDNTQTVYLKNNVFSGPETDPINNSNGNYRLDNTHFNLNGQNAVAGAWYTALTQTYGGQNFFSYNTALLNSQATTVGSPTCSSSPDCIVSSPVVIGTWNNYTVQLMNFDGNKVLVTVVPGGPNGAVKYFARGKNYWNSVNRYSNTDQYYNCITVGETGYGGLVLPFSTDYTPSGYSKGVENDGAVYYYQGGGGTCPTPNITASPGSVNAYGQSTLTVISSCPGGTIHWSTGQTGTSINVYPSTTTTYLAYCQTPSCTSNNGSVTVSVPATPPVSGGSGCSAENIAGVGNMYENATYTVNVNSAGNYSIKINYSEWESANGANGSVKVNGGSPQSFHVNYSGGPDTYVDYTFTANLNAGSNSFQIFGGSTGYIRLKKVCFQSGGRLGAVSGEPTIERVEPLSVGPNPNQGVFRVNCYVEPQQRAKLAITDMRGKAWFEQAFMGKGQEAREIQLAPQAKGMMIVSLTVEGKIISKKIVVQP